MLGDDKDIRSSLAVKEVLGQVDAERLGSAVQDRCGAGHLRVDASSKMVLVCIRIWLLISRA